MIEVLAFAAALGVGVAGLEGLLLYLMHREVRSADGRYLEAETGRRDAAAEVKSTRATVELRESELSTARAQLNDVNRRFSAYVAAHLEGASDDQLRDIINGVLPDATAGDPDDLSASRI